MPRTRYHLSRHAREESIPLRFGVVLLGPKLFLENPAPDEEATQSQRLSDRQKGREHVVGEMWTASQNGDFLGGGRLVVGPPSADGLDPVVVTVLPLDGLALRTSQNLSDHLYNERKMEGREWLTPEYIAQELHPLVARGELANQSQLADHIAERLSQPLREHAEKLSRENAHIRSVAEEAIAAVSSLEERVTETTSRATLAERGEKEALQRLEDAIQALKALESDREPSFAEMPLSAVEKTQAWRSRTGSGYSNLGLEATILGVSRQENRTKLTYIDQNRKSKTVEDFGYQGFVGPVHAYLESRVGKRAVFIVTQQGDKPLRLASDTMMLPQYKALWG